MIHMAKIWRVAFHGVNLLMFFISPTMQQIYNKFVFVHIVH